VENSKSLVIELATKPDIPNANGRVYSQVTYDPALFVFRKRIQLGTAFAILGFPNERHNVMVLQPKDIHSRIIKIDDGYGTIVPVTKGKYDYLMRLFKEGELALAMNYFGNLDTDGMTVTEMQIISYSIVPKFTVTRKEGIINET
jgi:hypothetical protein